MILKVEICPVCGRTNIAGNKYCYGSPPAKHDRVRFDWVEVVPLADLEAALGRNVGPNIASLILADARGGT